MEITAAVSRADTPSPKLEKVRLEEPRAGEILVRIVAVGICHTDLNSHEGMLAPLPIVLGHEGAGVIEALGPGVDEFDIGDHVLLSGGSCGKCPNCLENRPSYCDLAMPMNFGGSRLDGSTSLCCENGKSLHSHFFGQSSFATHAIVRQRTAVKVDKDLPLETLAPLGCGVITGAGAVIESLKVGYGDSIAIFGVGAVGLSAVMAAKLVGAQHIVAIDLNEQRMALAKELGATHSVKADEPDLVEKIRSITGRGVKFSLNTTTVGASHTASLACLAMMGECGFVAAPRGEWSPNILMMLATGKKLRGILGGDAAPRLFLPKLINYWEQGRFPFDRLIQTYSFNEIDKAFNDAKTGRAIKPVLIMPNGAA